MKNITIIAVIGICILSLTNCETFPGQLIISDDKAHNFDGLNVGGNLVLSGSGDVKVIGDAIISGVLIHSGSGKLDVTGNVSIKGKHTRSDAGNVKAIKDATQLGSVIYSGSGNINIDGTLTVRGKIVRSGSGKFKADGRIVKSTKQ